MTLITSGVFVVANNPQTGEWLYAADVQANGTYALSVPGGTYTLHAQGDAYAMEFYENAGPSADTATAITVTAGDTVNNINFSLEPGGTISGTVYADDGMTPLPNVNLWIAGTALPTCSDEQGHYTMVSVPLNVPYKIAAGGNNWCLGGSQYYLPEFWNNVPDETSATPITLTAAQPHRAGIDFSVSIGGSISGHLYASNGVTPITHEAWVDIDNLPDGSYAGGTGVNADGSYSIQLPPGIYRAHAAGNGYAIEFYEDQPGVGDNATPITVTAGATTPNIDFRLDPAGTVSGTVYAEDGVTPLSNINVDLIGVWSGACTDANGHYTIYHVPRNLPVKLRAYSDGWCGGTGEYAEEWWNNAPDEVSATPILLTDPQPDAVGIDFTLARFSWITGQVFESDGVTPVTPDANGVWITVQDAASWRWVESARTNADGTYSIAVPPGTYLLNAAGDYYAREFYENQGGQPDTATPVIVPANATVPNINFSLDPGGVIWGTVYAADGVTPLPNIGVNVLGTWTSNCTDANGQLWLPSLPQNTPLRVVAGGDNGCGGGTYAQEFWHEAAFEFQADPLTLTAAQPTLYDIDFTLETSGAITGTVTAEESGAPIADLWVCAINYDAVGFGSETSAFICDQTGADGVYSINVPAYNYRVWLFPEDRLREFYNNTTRYEDAAAVTVTAGATTTGIDFALPLAGIISGYAYLDDGVTPAVGASVATADGSSFECVQGDGSYRIWVTPGTHIVKVFAGACNPGYDFPAQYYRAADDVGSATPVTVGAGEQIYDINFVRGAPPYVPPTALTPTGASSTTAPAFTWTPSAGATWYHVWVSQLDGVSEQEFWYEATACSGTCAANNITLATGAYRWWVRGWHPTFGYTDWSAPLEFQITTPPAAPTQVSPFGLEATMVPSFTWNTVSGASWYYLWITGENGHVLDQWYAAAEWCGGGTCSVVPSVNFDGGNYQWWVQAWSPYGGYSPWSAGMSFTMMFFAQPQQIAPNGQVETAPLLQWQDMSGSSWWQVWINGTQGSGGGFWYDAGSICSGGTCSVAAPISINDDVYSWWVQTWNPVAGYSAWSSGMNFWLPLAAPVPTAPVGVVTTPTPTFTWAKQPHATWYYLWVTGPSGHVIDQWYDASAICAGGTCAVAPLTLPNGTYTFWAQGWSPFAGYGAWSASTNFTVNAP